METTVTAKTDVFKLISDYWSGAVNGMVAVLASVVCSVIFGYFNEGTGLLINAAMFMFALSATCVAWAHQVKYRVKDEEHPELLRIFNHY